MATAEEIKQGIANKKVEVESGNPEVEKTRIKVDAVKLLAFMFPGKFIYSI